MPCRRTTVSSSVGGDLSASGGLEVEQLIKKRGNRKTQRGIGFIFQTLSPF
jgi:hypothetical protein